MTTINFKVFPASLINGQKVPLIRGWNELASNDPAQIKLWQELFRDRITFWGVPCGAVNGIFVLDVDVKKVNGFESLKNLGYEIPNTLIQQTPSGGCHVMFRALPNIHYPNSVNSKLGLDTRGDRGWIAWYGNTNNAELMDAPNWLFNLAPKSENIQVSGLVRVAPEIAQGIFQNSLENIRQAPPGESNNVLNIESFKVGQLIASGSFTREFAEQELYKAAMERGKPSYESRATITSGLDGGLRSPLASPFTTETPKLNISIPEMPSAPERWTPSYLTRHDLLNTSKLRKPQLFRDWSTEDISITTADGGTGKTTLKLFESICLALGDRFLGFENVQRGKTLYITGEDSSAKLAAMLGAIMNQMGLFNPGEENAAKVQTVLNSVLIKKDADLCLIQKERFTNFLVPNSSAMEKLMHAVDDIKPKMIVFDPIASFWGSEAGLNDMNKAVTKFMSELVDRSQACVEMINHMGKASSATKDMSQFAGRGGSGLPSNSRVSRVLRSLTPEEFSEMTGTELTGDDTAMLCNINKFSDGSSMFGKPFVIKRSGYLFSRITLSPQKVREMEKQQSDEEKIFTFIKQCRDQNRYPTKDVVVGQFMNNGSPISKDRILRALKMLIFNGYMGEKVQEIDNVDLTKKEKCLIITDMDGKEA